MERKAIGVFDSGLGGLTALRVLEETLPHENLIYFGDTANMPYGPRSVEEISRLAADNTEFLLGKDIKAIVVACGTVSSNALDMLKEKFPVPFFGVIEPAVSAAVSNSGAGRVGVIATEASIRSGAYRRALEAAGMEVFDRACSSFVPLVESGHFRPEDELVKEAVERELSELRNFKPDTLILGCTHFPLLKEAIANFMGGDVSLISCGEEAALALARSLGETGLLNPQTTAGQHRYFTSGDPESFERQAEVFLGHPLKAEVK